MGGRCLRMPLAGILIALVSIGMPHVRESIGKDQQGSGSRILIRGVYGGVPTQILDRGRTLADYGVNAVWLGSGSLTREIIDLLRHQDTKVFAEFNTMHDASFLIAHPDAAPVGPDGKPSPPPDGWQGICPTHPGYRKARMDEFREILRKFQVDGIWLDYHHAHASWEQAVPELPDTCFCNRCLATFERESGIRLPNRSIPETARWLLGPRKNDWIKWRCHVFTDWVRQFREIRNEVRPRALLGTFHCPWTDNEFDGALRSKLAIDLKAQAEFLDVFSPMTYHARFGHVGEPAWIGHQIQWLGRQLGVEGKPSDRIKIWPIVQLSDWGEPVPATQVTEVLGEGTRPPATGVMVFVWGTLVKDWGKVESMRQAYRSQKP